MNMGVISIVVPQEQVEKTKVKGVKEADFRVCVGVNKTTNEFESVLVSDDDSQNRSVVLNLSVI